MIKYRLICSQEHEFEAWFKDSVAYDQQVEGKLVMCPVCSDVDVAKTIMAPGIKTGSAGADQFAEAKAHEVAQRILTAVGKLRDKVEDEFDYVGDQFADEARAIHYGDSDERGIYGEASEEETEELEEEGIEFFQFPGKTPRRDN